MKHNKINKKIIKILILLLVLLMCIIEIVDVYKCSKYYEDDPLKIPRKTIKSIELSKKDYKNDFEYLWDIICKSMPVVEKYKDSYNYNILNNKEKYEKKLNSIQNDYEFNCFVTGVLNDIPSIHTGFARHDYDGIFNASFFLSNKVRTDPELYCMTSLWDEECKNSVEIYDKHHSIAFSYVDGKYFFNNMYSYDECYGYELLEINEKPVDDFILSVLSAYKLSYDFKHDKLYRPMLFFNNGVGEKSKLTLLGEDGTKKYVDTYFSTEYEFAVCCYSDKSQKNKSTQLVEDYFIKLIDENILYCRIDNFRNKFGTDLYKKLREHCFAEDMSVILDMRYNGGGYIDYGVKNIYPVLYSENILVKDKEYLYHSFATREIYSVLHSGLYGYLNMEEMGFKKQVQDGDLLDFENYKNYFFSYEEEFLYKGLNEYAPDIYILISHNTASAADHFVSDVSQSSQTTIIGENTGGEKMGGQVMGILPNSKLVFSFYPEIYFNDDGTINSIYGTKPDIYSCLSVDDFLKRGKMYLENKEIDIFDYDNRMIWDTVLKDTMKLIKNKKNY